MTIRKPVKKGQPVTSLFRTWWMPTGYNSQTGAQTGGHPEALRKCVRPDTKAVAYFGIRVELAWECRRYREEFLCWTKDGMPERDFLEDGTAAPIDQQRSVLRQCLQTLRKPLKRETLMPQPDESYNEIGNA